MPLALAPHFWQAAEVSFLSPQRGVGGLAGRFVDLLLSPPEGRGHFEA